MEHGRGLQSGHTLIFSREKAAIMYIYSLSSLNISYTYGEVWFNHWDFVTNQLPGLILVQLAGAGVAGNILLLHTSICGTECLSAFPVLQCSIRSSLFKHPSRFSFWTQRRHRDWVTWKTWSTKGAIKRWTTKNLLFKSIYCVARTLWETFSLSLLDDEHDSVKGMTCFHWKS